MITSVVSLSTTVTDLGVLPVLCCSKRLAACAIWRAIVELGLSMAFILARCGRPQPPQLKKADVAKHPKVLNHVGLLCNEPPGTAGLPFIKSSDSNCDRSRIKRHHWLRTSSTGPRMNAYLHLQRRLRADLLPHNRRLDHPLGHLPRLRQSVFPVLSSASPVSARQRQNAGHLSDDIDKFTA